MLIIPMLNQIGNQPPSNFKIRKFGKLHDFGNFAKISKSLTAAVLVNFVRNIFSYPFRDFKGDLP